MTSADRSRPRRTALVGGMAAVLVVAGCGSSATGGNGSAAGASSPAPPVGTRTAGPTAPAAGSSAPSPTSAQAAALTTILQAVNPGVTTDKAVLVRNAITVCGRILAGGSPMQIAALTTQLYAHGAYTPQPAEALAIDSAITATFCR